MNVDDYKLKNYLYDKRPHTRNLVPTTKEKLLRKQETRVYYEDLDGSIDAAIGYLQDLKRDLVYGGAKNITLDSDHDYIILTYGLEETELEYVNRLGAVKPVENESKKKTASKKAKERRRQQYLKLKAEFEGEQNA